MNLIIEKQIQDKIYLIRNEQVMLDIDIANLYQVETKYLNRQVQRNIERFSDIDFMFQLTKEEFENLKCQNGTSSWGGKRKLPFVFTEQGLYMLTSVINSTVSITISKQIMRIFTKMRRFALNYDEIIKRLEINENETKENKELIIKAFSYLEQILTDTKKTDEKVIGFRPKVIK